MAPIRIWVTQPTTFTISLHRVVLVALIRLWHSSREMSTYDSSQTGIAAAAVHRVGPGAADTSSRAAAVGAGAWAKEDELRVPCVGVARGATVASLLLGNGYAAWGTNLKHEWMVITASIDGVNAYDPQGIGNMTLSERGITPQSKMEMRVFPAIRVLGDWSPWFPAVLEGLVLTTGPEAERPVSLLQYLRRHWGFPIDQPTVDQILAQMLHPPSPNAPPASKPPGSDVAGASKTAASQVANASHTAASNVPVLASANVNS
jgi:hypothetical protein